MITKTVNVPHKITERDVRDWLATNCEARHAIMYKKQFSLPTVRNGYLNPLPPLTFTTYDVEFESEDDAALFWLRFGGLV